MRLDFNILWIDDLPENIASLKDSVRRHILNEGFDLNAKVVKTIVEADEALGNEVFRDEVDLVLVDYDLGESPGGDTALKEIRTRLPYREIIFYSAKATADLRKLAYEQNVEGVYCTHRGDLVDAIGGVFETLVKKVLDIDHTRGIVLGATSGMDVAVHDCLLAIHNAMDCDGQEAMLDKAIERVNTKVEDQKVEADKAVKLGSLEGLLNHRGALTADHKLRFLIRTLDQGNFTSVEHLRKQITDYQTNVVPKRNILAHARLVPGGSETAFRGREGETITFEEMKELRCSLLSYRDAFSSLLRELSGE